MRHFKNKSFIFLCLSLNATGALFSVGTHWNIHFDSLVKFSVFLLRKRSVVIVAHVEILHSLCLNEPAGATVFSFLAETPGDTYKGHELWST
jgi:hypothetical protein